MLEKNQKKIFYILGPKSGGWSDWGPWMCDCGHLPGVLTHRSIASSCGLVRFRSCDNPSPDIGGLQCHGDRVDKKKVVYHASSAQDAENKCNYDADELNRNRKKSILM